MFAADSGITSYVITGQDAERDSVQYIIDGKQSMTVFKDIRTLVDDAVAAAETFLAFGTPASTTTYNNGTIDVPADPTEVITVDQTNITAVLIDSGYYSACDFTGIPGCPTFAARFPENQVHGYGWYPLGASITLTIDDPDNGVGIDYTDTQQIIVAEWDPNQTWVRFALDTFELQPGQIVSMTDGTATKTHTVTNLAITNIDPVADTVSGTAEPGSQVEIGWICDDLGCAFRRVTTNGSGNWLADFSEVGEDGDEQDLFDIVPGTGNEARQPDIDGDSTTVQWWVPNPNFSARFPEKQVHGYDWPLDSDVTISIDDPSTGIGEDYTATVKAIEAPWNSAQTFAQFYLTDFTLGLQPGQKITMTDGLAVKVLDSVSILEITDVNVSTDTVIGVVEPNASVDVDANCGDNGCIFQSVTADGSGDWSADFSAISGGDIKPGSSGEARTFDTDGDATTVQWHILNPYIEASVQNNWIHAREWPIGTEMKLEIDDLSNGLGGVDYSAIATMGQAPWNPGDPNDIVADFDMGAFMLEAGDVILVSENIVTPPVTKALTVSALQATSFDIAADTVSGVATAGAEIEICVNTPSNCISRTVTATGGTWTVDYTSDYDLQPGDNGWAAEFDIDSDQTRYDWNIPNPYIQVRANEDRVEGQQWTFGETVTITVNHPGGSTSAPQTAVVGTAPWDPSQTYFESNFGSAFNIQVGDIVTVTGGTAPNTITRTTTVTNLAFRDIDIDSDIVTGIATAGANVDIWTCDDMGCNTNRHVQADALGYWTADFGNLGTQPDEQTTFDIVSGSWIDSSENDSNGNSTMYGLTFEPPMVMSITRANTNPTNASSVNFTVTFSDPVMGVDLTAPSSDFSLITSGVTGASITGVSGTDASYTVTVNTGSGNGTIRLDVPVTATITDLIGTPLNGLPFTNGETYTISKFPLPSSWIGGISVTSDKNVVSVGRPHIGSEIASYDGFSAGAHTAYIPMLFRGAYGGTYNAAFYIQNVDAGTANITISYYDSTGALTCSSVDTITTQASKGYWLPGTCVPANWVGGAVVTSDKNIVAIGRPHIGAEVMTYSGFSSGSLTSYIPMLFRAAYGGTYNAAFYVQNVGAASANLTIKYYDSTGALTCTATDTVAKLASKGYWLPGTCVPANWVGGAVITSTEPIVTVGRPHIGTQITTYNGFSAGSGTSYVPMLFRGAFGGTYNAAFYVQNVSGSAANVTIKYYDLAGALTCTATDTLSALASKGYWLPGTCVPAGWVGGAVITSDQDIVTVGRPHIGAQVTTYDGFTSGSLASYLPMLFKNAYGGTYNAAYYIQNTEATAATVTTKYYDSTGTLTCSRSDTLAPFSTLSLWAPSLTCVP